jgi:hypothetical protein
MQRAPRAFSSKKGITQDGEKVRAEVNIRWWSGRTRRRGHWS